MYADYPIFVHLYIFIPLVIVLSPRVLELEQGASYQEPRILSGSVKLVNSKNKIERTFQSLAAEENLGGKQG